MEILNRFLLVCSIIFLLQFLFGLVAFGDEKEDPSDYLRRQNKTFQYLIYGYVLICVIGLFHILFWVGYFIIKG